MIPETLQKTFICSLPLKTDASFELPWFWTSLRGRSRQLGCSKWKKVNITKRTFLISKVDERARLNRQDKRKKHTNPLLSSKTPDAVALQATVWIFILPRVTPPAPLKPKSHFHALKFNGIRIRWYFVLWPVGTWAGWKTLDGFLRKCLEWNCIFSPSHSRGCGSLNCIRRVIIKEASLERTSASKQTLSPFDIFVNSTASKKKVYLRMKGKTALMGKFCTLKNLA